MAVNKMNDYTAQQTGRTKSAGSVEAASRRKDKGASAEQKAAADTTDEGIRYDVTDRTKEVAAWYQEYVRQEQEDILHMLQGQENKTAKGQTDQSKANANLTAQLLGESDETDGSSDKETAKSTYEKKLDEQEQLLESLKRMVERMREQREKQNKEKKTQQKKLSYSYRKVSSSISSAKTSQQASNALSSATANLSSLKRKAASGQYKDSEVELALQHAQRMVRTARKKVNNIKAEERKKALHTSTENQAEQQKKVVHRTPDRHKVNAEIERLKKEMRQEEKRQKHANRGQEDLELMQADMTYLKRKIDLLKQEGVSLYSSNGAFSSDEALAAAFGITDVQNKADAMQARESGSQSAASAEGAAAITGAVSAGFDVSV